MVYFDSHAAASDNSCGTLTAVTGKLLMVPHVVLLKAFGFKVGAAKASPIARPVGHRVVRNVGSARPTKQGRPATDLSIELDLKDGEEKVKAVPRKRSARKPSRKGDRFVAGLFTGVVIGLLLGVYLGKKALPPVHPTPAPRLAPTPGQGAYTRPPGLMYHR